MNAKKWLPLVVAVLALGLFGYGAAAFLGDLRAHNAPPPAANAPADDGPPMIAGKKRPKAFSLPEYPSAYAYNSIDDGTRDRGSAAFTARKGTAVEIAAFYRRELRESGWDLANEKPVKQRPGYGAVPNPPLVTGLRQTWTERNGKRVLHMLALDMIQPHSTAQVALSWSPGTEGDTDKR